MNNYDDDEDEDQVQKIVIPKYKLLYSDGEITSKLPVPEEEDKPAVTVNDEEKKEEQPPEEGEQEGPKSPIEKILTSTYIIINFYSDCRNNSRSEAH